MKEPVKSQKLFEEAQLYLPGGVNSPVRAFKAVGGHPLFIKRGSGSKIYDEDGNEYIDYVCSWGPLILGHSHPQVIAAIKKVVENGTTFGAPTELETVLAKAICAAMPSIEMIRFVSSGTEAAMSALRLARAYTGRDRIIKFDGCYHGHSDGLLVKAGSGLATLGIPDCPGVPAGYARQTLIAPYNDAEAVRQLFKQHPGDIAAVIIEPVAANMGLVPPAPCFLEGLRHLCNEFGALLIFDEVITGFRLGCGGVQAFYKVTPDLTCLGKIIGGGMPVGAYGGRKNIMKLVAPSGSVYQAGTLSGNPVAMTAGIETIKLVSEPGFYQRLEENSAELERGIENAAGKVKIPVSVARTGSLLTIFFTGKKVTDYESAKKSDTKLFSRFFTEMLAQGIYWPPSQFEAAFVSAAHSEKDIQATVDAIEKAFQTLSS